MGDPLPCPRALLPQASTTLLPVQGRRRRGEHTGLFSSVEYDWPQLASYLSLFFIEYVLPKGNVQLGL